MSLTTTDLNQIEKIVDKKLDAKLANLVARKEFQMMINAVDERFNQVDKKIENVDQKLDSIQNTLDAFLHEVQDTGIEQTVLSHRVSQHDDTLTKIKKVLKNKLAVSI